MIMEARAKRLATPLQWGRREKAAVGGVLAALVIALVALGAYALSSGGSARKDCVDVTFASTLGGAELKGCGARAMMFQAQHGWKRRNSGSLSLATAPGASPRRF